MPDRETAHSFPERPAGLGYDAGHKFVATLAGEAPILQGRRQWLSYLDFGVTDASNGRMRVQHVIASGKTVSTGWHYHTCEMQFVYVLKGYVEIRLADGAQRRLEVGDTAYIPGGYPHNEVGMSPDFEYLEISVPADLGTVPCEPPKAWQKETRARPEST